MKSNYISIRAAVTAIGALCCATLLPSVAYAAGALSVNGSTVCASSTTMNLNPAGDIIVACTAPNSGNPTSPPSCTVSVSPASITAGSSASITAACNPAASSWLWSVTGGGPAMSGPSASLTFPTAGTYVYTVTPSNTAGSGAPAAGTVIVTAGTGTGGPPAGCTPIATSGGFQANGTKLIQIDRGAKVSYALPVYATAGRTLEILSIQSTASQSDLTSEFSVSACPGDFDTVPAECKTWGTVNQSGTQLYASTNGNQLAGTCTVITGVQYYINVRNTQFDRVTPACTQANTCFMNLQLNSY
jgi:hypothetical protein